MLLPQPLLKHRISLPHVMCSIVQSKNVTCRNLIVIADSISIEKRSASTVASVIRYCTGVDLMQMPDVPIME
jgi:hypothetical protein